MQHLVPPEAGLQLWQHEAAEGVAVFRRESVQVAGHRLAEPLGSASKCWSAPAGLAPQARSPRLRHCDRGAGRARRRGRRLTRASLSLVAIGALSALLGGGGLWARRGRRRRLEEDAASWFLGPVIAVAASCTPAALAGPKVAWAVPAPDPSWPSSHWGCWATWWCARGSPPAHDLGLLSRPWGRRPGTWPACPKWPRPRSRWRLPRRAEPGLGSGPVTLGGAALPGLAGVPVPLLASLQRSPFPAQAGGDKAPARVPVGRVPIDSHRPGVPSGGHRSGMAGRHGPPGPGAVHRGPGCRPGLRRLVRAAAPGPAAVRAAAGSWPNSVAVPAGGAGGAR